MDTKLSWLDRRHNAKAKKLIAALEEDIRARQTNGEEITEIVVSKSMEKKLAIIEMIPIDEAIKYAEEELREIEEKLVELDEEQTWRRCCK